MADSEAPANDEGSTPGTSLPSAPSDLSIADMEQRIERIKAEYYIWRDSGIAQYSMLRKAQLKALHEEETAAAATERAMEALQQQKDVLESARAKMDVLNTYYQKVMVPMLDLKHERAKEGAAEIQALEARIDEARKQVAAHNDSKGSSTRKGA